MTLFSSNDWKIIINRWNVLNINKLIINIENIKNWDLEYLKIKEDYEDNMNHKENIINCFKILIHNVQANDEKAGSFKIREYTDTIKAISIYNNEITCIEDVKTILLDYGKKKPTKILLKIKEILESGTTSTVEKAKKNPLVIAVTNLTKIYSIGNKKAIELYNNYGIMNIEDLRKNIKENPKIINKKQQIGLTYYDDLIMRIPRKEMIDYENTLLNIAKIVDPNIKLSINGSFRRECSTSGDIDVLITSNDINSRKKFINYLKNNHIIIETLASGSKKFMGISRLKDYKIHRHIDIIETTREEYAFGVLYFTGSGGFNIKMRRQALSLGYTLNEYCLSHYTTKIKISSEEIFNKLGKTFFEEEIDIFNFLDMEYVEPRDRNSVTISKI